MSEFQTVLFLCTGNFYRSRYAEALFNHTAIRTGLLWRAESRGFRPHLADEPISEWALRRMSETGVPVGLTRLQPAALTGEVLAGSSLVIALRRSEHYPMIESQFPRWAERLRFWDIADIDELAPEFALPMIEAEVANLIRQLSEGHAIGINEDALAEF